MTIPVLICDDSGMARKQMARSLPPDWDVEVSFATNGVECLEAIEQGKGDVLFLDLNMPVMDGYGVLEQISERDLPTMVIVVSGDIQPEARARVKKLGAIDFIKKPTSPELVRQLLSDYGIHQSTEPAAGTAGAPPAPVAAAPQAAVPRAQPAPVRRAKGGEDDVPTFLDCLQEVSNIAMGRAGDLLARLLNVFVMLPIPKVNLLEVSELQMALSAAGSDNNAYSAVCQGFIGAGVAGEALLIFSDSSFDDMAKLLRYPETKDRGLEIEVLMDMSNVLVGAFLKGLADQLDITFGLGHPSVLGQHLQVSDLLEHNASRWRRMLSIEINYTIEKYDVNCDLLMLFTEDAVPALEEKLRYLMG